MDVLSPRIAARTLPSEAVFDRTWIPTAVVGASTLISAAWIGSQLLRRDVALATPSYDQAFFQQVVWNLGHGHGFVSSFNPGSFLGVHFSPLLVVPAALEWLWPDPRLLSIFNAVAVALVAPAAFLFLRAAFAPSRFGAFLAAPLAAVLPFTPTMQEVARAGFHTETLAFPAVLMAGWAGLVRKPVLMWALAAIPLLAKEDQVYAVGVIALLVAVRGRGDMRRHGLLLLGAAAIWGVALFLVIMPALRGGADSDTHSYYAWLGPFPTQLLAPIREPGAFWNQLLNTWGWMAAAGLVLSLGLVPLLRPAWALPVLPALILNLLSRHYPQPELHLQYALLIVAPALVAAAMGGRRALFLLRRTRMAPAMIALAVPGLLLGVLAGSLPPANDASTAFARPAGLDALMTITAVIPADAPVAADDDVAAPLASRPEIHVLPSVCDGCYVVIDRRGEDSPFMSPAQRNAILAALPANRRLMADDGRFEVWSPAGE